MAEKKLSDDMIKRIKELEGSMTADNENEVDVRWSCKKSRRVSTRGRKLS